jgi:hypothetical protein
VYLLGLEHREGERSNLAAFSVSAESGTRISTAWGRREARAHRGNRGPKFITKVVPRRASNVLMQGSVKVLEVTQNNRG